VDCGRRSCRALFFSVARAVLGLAVLAAAADATDRPTEPPALQSACASNPWLDVRCFGAVGNDSNDDTAALADALRAAIADDQPLFLPHGTYKLTRPLVIDYAARANTGFRLISMGAILDGRSIVGEPVLQVVCSGGSPTAPRGCFYFKEEGSLFVYADTDAYAVVFGRRDFADAQNSLKIDHLIVNNANAGARSGGLQLNYVLDSEIFAVADSAGGAAGIALEQMQTSRLSGAGSAAAPGGAALLIENGYSFANTIDAVDLEVAPTCLVIASPRAAHNTFVSPYLACPTGVDATAGNTMLVNPLFAGNVRREFAASVGVVTTP
jgi:Pectate lyase superfamily protein